MFICNPRVSVPVQSSVGRFSFSFEANGGGKRQVLGRPKRLRKELVELCRTDKRVMMRKAEEVSKLALGQQCPSCSGQTFHNKGSYRQCSRCGYVGWPWSHAPTGVGSGRGNRCPQCDKLTLHDIVEVPGKYMARRCTTCNYVSIEIR